MCKFLFWIRKSKAAPKICSSPNTQDSGCKWDLNTILGDPNLIALKAFWSLRLMLIYSHGLWHLRLCLEASFFLWFLFLQNGDKLSFFIQCKQLKLYDFLRSLCLREMESFETNKQTKKEWEKRKNSEEAGVMKSQLANAPEDKVRLLEVAVEWFFSWIKYVGCKQHLVFLHWWLQQALRSWRKTNGFRWKDHFKTFLVSK